MTAKEEDILTNSIIHCRLFQSLIISNGDGVPVKYIDITIGDKNAIMIAARILGYGKDYEVEIDDPSTPGLKQKDVIDLTQFESHEYDGSNQTELHQNDLSIT